MTDLHNKILKELDDINKYELDQTDSFTNQTQLLFLIATVILGTSFLSIVSDDLFIKIFKIAIFTIVIIAFYFAMPYLRGRKYITSPVLGEFEPFIEDSSKTEDEFVKNLIYYKIDQYRNNIRLNAKREHDFKICSVLLIVSVVLIFFLFVYYYFVTDGPNGQTSNPAKNIIIQKEQSLITE
jgi:hypothetical protein